jgi:hypothetical protein
MRCYIGPEVLARSRMRLTNNTVDDKQEVTLPAITAPKVTHDHAEAGS